MNKTNIQPEPVQARVTSYIAGFVLSIFLTMSGYFLVVNHLLTSQFLLAAIVILAVIQLLVQLFFFLHLGRESRPRWNLLFFLSTVSIILIVVVGSIWIMSHLNYNMTPKDMNAEILIEEGINKFQKESGIMNHELTKSKTKIEK